jgi:hypothetical protein
MPTHRTRSMASITDFKHIMSAILGQKDDSPLSIAFASGGICDLFDVVTSSDSDIDELKWHDPSFTPVKGKTRPDDALNNGLKRLVRAFKAFVKTRKDEGNPIHDDWQNKAK